MIYLPNTYIRHLWSMHQLILESYNIAWHGGISKVPYRYIMDVYWSAWDILMAEEEALNKR